MSNFKVERNAIKRNATSPVRDFIVKELSSYVTGWFQGESTSIWRDLMPRLPIRKSKVKLLGWKQGSIVQKVNGKVLGGGTERSYRRVEQAMMEVKLKNYQFGVTWDEFDERDDDDVFDWARDMAQVAAEDMDRFMEAYVWNKFLVTGKWNTDVALTNAWNDYIGQTSHTSNPIEDMEARFDELEKLGFDITMLYGACNSKVYRILRRHPDILDKVLQVVRVSDVSELDMLPFRVEKRVIANAMGLQDLYVSRTYENSANKTDDDDADYDLIGNDNFLLFYKNGMTLRSRMAKSAGVRIIDTGLPGNTSEGIRVLRPKDYMNPGNYFISNEIGVGFELLDPRAGFLFTGTTS